MGVHLIEYLRMKATVKMTMDEIMTLTQGEDSAKWELLSQTALKDL